MNEANIRKMFHTLWGLIILTLTCICDRKLLQNPQLYTVARAHSVKLQGYN